MFCPSCSAYLTERDLIKTAVKYAPGNVPIEYEAQCPRCLVDMGKVSWGQLSVNPDIKQKVEEKPVSAPTESGPAPVALKQKRCPHCGKTLPEDF